MSKPGLLFCASASSTYLQPHQVVILTIVTASALYGTYSITMSRSVIWFDKSDDVLQDHASWELNKKTSYEPLPRRRRFPDVILVGMKKCGTKFLLKSMAMHSRISFLWSEVHYFDHLKRYNLSWYLDMMPVVEDSTLVMEKTPRYFVWPGAASNISMMSNVRVLVSLRNPVARTISDYMMLDRLKKTKGLSLEQMILSSKGEIFPNQRQVLYSTYAKFMPAWLAHFKLGETFEIIDGDNLIEHPWEELERIQDFLGLKREITKSSFVFNKEKGFYCIKPKSANKSEEMECLGSGKGHKDHTESKLISQKAIDKLKLFFEKPNEKLFEMIGRRYNWTYYSE